MASMGTPRASSSSYSTPSRIYDVFLNFYGEDTRKGFIDHLHAALKRKGIFSFRDDEKLEQGKDISLELMKAIQKSQYAVVVISERYAFSTWCLNELTEIMNCKSKSGLIVLPVFYYVEPSDVRKQKGSFAKAFAKHDGKTEIDEKQKKIWKAALEDVSHLSGWHVVRHEATIVEDISQQILNGVNRSPLNILKGLVGIDSRASKLISLLALGSNDVHFIGICGMGGIGKTTLANIIYDRVSSKFEASCFVADIRENTQKHGVVYSQTQLVCEIRYESNLKIWNCRTGIDMIARSVHNRNVFIVLDDVDNEDQLKALAGSHLWFGLGSRIIVTSRDYHLLNRYVDEVYEVPELNEDESLELFCWKAFDNDQPKQNYIKLSKDIVHYAEGLPLAIEVFGSYLFGKKMDAWKAAQKQLKENIKKNIFDKLQISYEGLEDSQKRLFLDIACLLDGKYYPTIYDQKLEVRHHYLKIDIEVLNDRCLIKNFKGQFSMHDLLKKMGQQIVYLESTKEPGRRSRLWDLKDIERVLNNNTGTDAVEGIRLTSPLLLMKLSLEGFSKMNKLEILICGDSESHNYPNFHWYGEFSNFRLSNELLYLQFVGYPLQFLPNSFKPKHLAALELPYNNIRRLDGLQGFDKLKYLDMSLSHNLIETPNFEQLPNLKELDFQRCKNLFKLHSSLGLMKQLEKLDLKGCQSLEVLPKEIKLESLTYLNLAGCSRVTEFPNIVGNMTSLKFLDLNGAGIKKLPLSFQSSSSIEVLNLCGSLRYRNIVIQWKGYYENKTFTANYESLFGKKFFRIFSYKSCLVRDTDIGIRSLNSSCLQLQNFSSLKALDLSFLNISDADIPTDFSYLLSIKLLNLSGNNFTTLPFSVGELSNLEELHLGHCTKLQSLPKSLFSRFGLRRLNLSYCNLLDGIIPQDLSGLSSLANLDLTGNKFKSIPDLAQLSMLFDLCLNDCTQLQALPKFPMGLNLLTLDNCHSLEIIYAESAVKLTNHCTSLSFGIDLDGRLYKVVKQFLCTRDFNFQRPPHGFSDDCKIMGSALASVIPEWFNQKISSSIGTMESCFQWLDEGWHGIALLIIYQVHEPVTFERERKVRKLDERGNSNYKIFDGKKCALPQFLCRLQDKGQDWIQFLPLCAPEVPSAGSNAFWVFIRYHWIAHSVINHDHFGRLCIGSYHRDCVARGWYDGDVSKKGCLDASIESCNLNVEVECWAREVYWNDLSEFAKVISDISPDGLDSETCQKFFGQGLLNVYGLVRGTCSRQQ